MQHLKSMERLCMRAISSEITPPEMEILEKWMAESDENRQVYEAMREAWKIAEQPRKSFNPDVENEWKRFENSVILRPGKRKSKGFIPLIPIVTPRFRLASVLALLFVLAAGWKVASIHSSIKTIKTGYAKTAFATLPDGSRVQLNADSKIRYAKTFGEKERVVNLEGEAFFEVNPGEIPFVVRTENARTSVLGTKFNVKFRGEKTSVIVCSGRVRLSSNKSNEGVTLIHDQKSEITSTGNPMQAREVDAARALGWMEGVLVFENEPLRNVMREIERQYDVRIDLDKRLAERKLTARLEKQSINLLMNQVCLAFHADYTMDSHRIFIFPQ